MNRILVLVLYILVCISYAHAQTWPTRAILKSPFKISRVLSKRVSNSYVKACMAQASYAQTAHLLVSGPSKRLRVPLVAKPVELYPQAPYLDAMQLSDYFLAQQNRDVIKMLPYFQNWSEELFNSTPLLKNLQQPVPQDIQNDMQWLSSQITPNLSYFLLGEVHYEPAIQQQITNLLGYMRNLNPNRQIFLFTEFLPKEQIWDIDITQSPFKEYTKVWKAATENNITTIGLEPEFVDNNDIEMFYHNATTRWDTLSSFHRQNIWASLEGMKIRNGDWITTINKYRCEYPDALFIIYAGAGHLSVAEPYSIGAALPRKNTFIANLFPEKAEENAQLEFPDRVSSFDQITKGEFPDRIVLFNDEGAVNMAGFNARIKVPKLDQ